MTGQTVTVGDLALVTPHRARRRRARCWAKRELHSFDFMIMIRLQLGLANYDVYVDFINDRSMAITWTVVVYLLLHTQLKIITLPDHNNALARRSHSKNFSESYSCLNYSIDFINRLDRIVRPRLPFFFLASSNSIRTANSRPR